MSLKDIESGEIIAEAWTPYMQAYADGLLDGLDGTIGSRVPK